MALKAPLMRRLPVCAALSSDERGVGRAAAGAVRSSLVPRTWPWPEPAPWEVVRGSVASPSPCVVAVTDSGLGSSSFCTSATRAGSSATEMRFAEVLSAFADQREDDETESVPVTLAAWPDFGEAEAPTGGAALLASDGAAMGGGPNSACSGPADVGGPMGVVAFSRRPSSAAKTGSSSTETPFFMLLAEPDRCAGATERVPVILAVLAPSPGLVPAVTVCAATEDAARMTDGGRETTGEAIFAIELVSEGSPGSTSMELPLPVTRGPLFERCCPEEGATCSVPVTRPLRTGDSAGTDSTGTAAEAGAGAASTRATSMVTEGRSRLSDLT